MSSDLDQNIVFSWNLWESESICLRPDLIFLWQLLHSHNKWGVLLDRLQGEKITKDKGDKKITKISKSKDIILFFLAGVIIYWRENGEKQPFPNKYNLLPIWYQISDFLKKVAVHQNRNGPLIKLWCHRRRRPHNWLEWARNMQAVPFPIIAVLRASRGVTENICTKYLQPAKYIPLLNID